MSSSPEEPTLPPLPQASYSSSPVVQTPICNPRKRALQLSECQPPNINTSSDPAFFSSDDDPSLENYQPSSERSKRRLIGSWYEHNVAASSDPIFAEDALPKPVTRPVARRIFRRDFDSGIFLGSDGTITADDDTLSMPPPPLPMLTRPRNLTLGSMRQVSMAEQAARQIVETCVEEGKESIDLSGFSLDSIDNDLLAPISTLTCIPTVVDGAPFEPKDPEIKLLLSNNCLTCMPGAILDIENIIYLSLRGNQLTELPSCLGKLTKLETLNVALNKLRYLPKSLLNLLGKGGNLQCLHIHPNPFIQPDEKLTVDDVSAEQTLALSSGKSAVYLARSATQFLSTAGTVCSRVQLPLLWGSTTISSSGLEIDAAVSFVPAKMNKAPSLTELVLRQCYSSSHLNSMSNLLEGNRFDKLRHMLEETQKAREQRGRYCSRCATRFVMPAVQWLEWWALGDAATQTPTGEAKKAVFTINEDGSIAVPFLAEGCNWGCTAADLERGVSLELLRA